MEGQISAQTMMSIQCDWESFIQVPYKSFWIAQKKRNEQSTTFHVRGSVFESNNTDFSATLEGNSLCVNHKPSGSLCHFIPAAKLFKNNQHKEIACIDASEGGVGVSCCHNGKLLIWDATNGQVRKELIGHAADIYKCILMPSGQVVASAGADMQIKIWSGITGECPVTLRGHKRPITGLSIVDRGRNIVSVSKDGRAALWYVAQSRCIADVLTTTQQLTCCDIGELPDDQPREKSADKCEVGTEDKILLVGSEEGDIYGVQLSTKKTLFVRQCSAAVNAIIYFSKELFVAGLQDGKVLQCSLKDGNILKIMHESDSAVLCLARFREKGVLLGRNCGAVSYLNPFSDTLDRIHLTGPDCDPVYTIAITNDAIYTGCRDSKIRKYQVSDVLSAGV